MRFFPTRLLACLPLALLAASPDPVFAQNPPAANAPLSPPAFVFSPPALKNALGKRRKNSPQIANVIRQAWGSSLKAGSTKTEDTMVAWAIEIPGLSKKITPVVVSTQGGFSQKLTRLGDTGVYAAVATLPEGAAFEWNYLVDSKIYTAGDPKNQNRRVEVYTRPPEAREQGGVPKGKLTQMPAWKSPIFAGTSRDWWVYVPAQYSPDKPASVMVFQDGGGPKNSIPTVFDNMIAKGEMPVTVGIFIQPGTFEGGRSNRSVEYDTLSDKYARMLLEEILPEVEKTTKLSHDPNQRAIYGVSSGGICAFTVAWERPDEFRKVATCVGSFVNLQGGPTKIGGGHNYPTLIRQSKAMPKPIRMFLCDGANDLDNPFGNWPLANMGMDKALAYAGYDHKFVFGNGFHGGKFGDILMPDILRWLWRPDGAPAPAMRAVPVSPFPG